MSKYGSSKKNTRLSNIAFIIAMIAICAIVLSNSIVRTILITIGAVSVLLFIWRKMDKIKK